MLHISVTVLCQIHAPFTQCLASVVLCLSTPAHISLTLPDSLSVWHVAVWTGQDGSDAEEEGRL